MVLDPPFTSKCKSLFSPLVNDFNLVFKPPPKRRHYCISREWIPYRIRVLKSVNIHYKVGCPQSKVHLNIL